MSSLAGGNEWPGKGLSFGYPYGQGPDAWVDVYGPIGDAQVQLVDQGEEGRAISNIVASRGYRILTSAVIFGALREDNSPFSTQERYMARIVAFLLNDDQIPPGPVPETTAELTSGRLTISWDPVQENDQGGPEWVDSYSIERSMPIGGHWISLGTILGTEFVDDPACVGDPAQNCMYRIRAIDTSGNTGAGGFAGEFDFQLISP